MGKVYIELKTKDMIPEEEALEYAIINTFGVPDNYNDFVKSFCWEDGPQVEIINLFIKKDKETLKSFVEWFFSGNWITKDKEDINNVL